MKTSFLLSALVVAALSTSGCAPTQSPDTGVVDAGACVNSFSGDGGGGSATCTPNASGSFDCECTVQATGQPAVRRTCTGTGATCADAVYSLGACCEW